MKATKKQIRDLANAVAAQAESIAQETKGNDLTDRDFHARAKLLASNVSTLVEWTSTGAGLPFANGTA